MIGFLEMLSLLSAGDQFVIHSPTPTSFSNVRGIVEMNRGECRMRGDGLSLVPIQSSHKTGNIKFSVKVPLTTYQW